VKYILECLYFINVEFFCHSPYLATISSNKLQETFVNNNLILNINKNKNCISYNIQNNKRVSNSNTYFLVVKFSLSCHIVGRNFALLCEQHSVVSNTNVYDAKVIYATFIVTDRRRHTPTFCYTKTWPWLKVIRAEVPVCHYILLKWMNLLKDIST